MSRLPSNFPLFVNSRVGGHQKWTPDSGARIYLLILEIPVEIAFCIFASYSPIMFPCSQRHQAARHSWSPANGAAAMCHPASGSSLTVPAHRNQFPRSVLGWWRDKNNGNEPLSSLEVTELTAFRSPLAVTSDTLTSAFSQINFNQLPLRGSAQAEKVGTYGAER